MRRVFLFVMLFPVLLGLVYAPSPARGADSYNELFGLGSHSEDANLEGWWKLDDNAASTTLVDSSSNGRNGAIVTGNSADVTEAGFFWWSASIDSQSGADYGTATIPDLVDNWTVGISCTPAAGYANFSDVVSIGTHGGARQYKILVGDNGSGVWRAQLGTGSTFFNVNGNAITTGTNINVAATYDKTTLRLYENGSETGNGATTLTSHSNTDMRVYGGLNQTGPSYTFPGNFAGSYCFSRTLAAAEVAQIDAGPEPIYTSGASLSGAGAYNVGTWDSQSNGTLLYTVQVVDPSGTVLATVAESGTTSGTVDLGDYSGIAYLLVKAVNNGGADTGDFATRTSGYGSSGDSYYELTSGNIEAASYNQLFGLGSYSVDFNLEGWYLLDETGASTSIADSSGNSRTGAIVGGNTAAGLTAAGPGGWLPNALDLDGTSDYISLPAGVDGIGQPKTLLGRFYSDANADRRIWGSSTADRNYLTVTSANLLAGSWGSTITTATGATTISTATWYSAASTLDASGNMVVYLDGSSDGTNTGASSSGGSNINIGSNNDGGGSFWNGRLADCSTWSRALSATEIAQWHAGPEPYYNGGGIAAPSGITQVGETLTAATDAGNWVDPSNGTVVYAYQWFRANDGAGTGAAAISGATSSTYVLQFADDTKYIACQITASNTGGSDPTYGVVMSSYSAQVADTAPALVTKTIDAAGTSLTLVFDQTMQFESSPNSTGLTLHVDAGTPTLTYASGTGSTTLVYTIGTTVNSGQTCTLDYNSTTGDIEDVSGTDLATFSGSAVTNNSVQSGGGPTATNVTVTGIMREGETLTGSYTYNANGNGAEGTSTYRWLASDVAISGATSTTYVLTSAENADDIKFEVTPVSNDPVSGSATPSIAYGPVGAALANTPVLVVWPDTAVGEGDSDPPDRLALGSGVTTGRTVANVIRARFRTATANDPETTSDFTNAAAARFTDDGYNVVVVNNDLAPTKDIILYPYATAVTTGFAGWADTEIVDYFEDNIDALFDAGYRVDCLLLDLENGIFGSDYGSIPDGAGGEGESVVTHMRGTVLPGLSGDYSSLPSGPNYATYLSASTSSQDFYDQRTLFNQAVMDVVREQIYDNCLVHYFERYPSGVVATYNRNDWASPQPNRTIATLYEPDSTVYGASSPELYYGLDHSREQIANLASKATSYPWVNPSTFTAADDAAYPVLVDYCDAQGMPLIATWASRKTLGERATEAPEIGTAAAKYDAQISVADTSGNSLTPTKNGFDETTDYREGPGGYFPSAWDIYGSNNLTIADSLLGTEGTCSMWVCTDDLATSRLALGSDATNRHWIGVDASGNLYARLGAAAAFGTTAATAGTWYHVCLCWNSGGGEFFINNSSAGTVSTTVNAITAGSGRIAAFSGGANWNGGIAGVRFYSSDLAADSTTRTSLYNEGKALFFTDPDTVGLPTPGNLLFAPHVPSDFNYSIQWYKDASPVSGATSHFIDWASHGFGSYFPRVTVTNGLGSTVTDGPTVNTYLIPREQLQGRLTNLKSGL